LGCRERRRRFAVAYLDGRPIAAARWRYGSLHPAVHLSGAETLPEFRNRGAYSTLVEFRARQALQRGKRYATIIADETTSAPILMKRGFVSVGRATIYLWPSDRFSSS
ncbi:MAG TPA: GNAT family N-acetyltransferase, partial [Verrucomicrobiae bacterium]|nr:GNAT family N-acetyltransferase [Verrucomicrobiae bacterium]